MTRPTLFTALLFPVLIVLGCGSDVLIASSTSSNGGASSTSSGGSGGAPCTPFDDGDPCTDDTCDGSGPIHIPAPAGSPCSIGGALCDSVGACVECLAPSDCPGADDECIVRTCVNGMCGVLFTPAGTAVTEQTAGDCLEAVCDGSGNVVAIMDDADVPADDGNACTDEACDAGSPIHPAIADGSACDDGDACTQTDTCQAGTCTGQDPLVCPGVSSCGVGACVVSACAGVVGLPGRPQLQVGVRSESMVAADLNGDGLPDLVVANNATKNVSVLRNQGGGTFATAVNYAAGTTPEAITAADLNGDGRPDLVVGNYGSNSVGVLRNQGNGTFETPVNYAAGFSPTAIATADLNGDGDPDLVVANSLGGNVSVLINQGGGSFATAVSYPAVSSVSLVAVDLNGDGRSDLVAANQGNDSVTVMVTTCVP